MFRKRIKLLIALIVIALKITVLFGEGYVAAQEIMLVVNPKKTEFVVGSGQIVITADAPGTNLTFSWKLEGPGKLEGKGMAVFYKIPEKIEKEAQTTVSVTVKDKEGQETTATVTFTILPVPTPSSESKSAEQQDMRTTTKIALGAGAVAALGGGIAIVAAGGDGDGDGDGDSSCGGVKVGGYCWYIGTMWIPCSSVCADRGGYHEATRTYAGSSGTDQNCWDVLTALGTPADTDGHVAQTDARADGCSYAEDSDSDTVHWQRAVLPTTAEGNGWNRACACNE